MSRKNSTKSTTLSLLSDPRKVARELRTFSQSARMISSNYNQLVKRYPKRWVAVYEGTVRADAKSFNALMNAVNRLGLPRGQVVVRYLDEDQRVMIL